MKILLLIALILISGCDNVTEDIIEEELTAEDKLEICIVQGFDTYSEDSGNCCIPPPDNCDFGVCVSFEQARERQKEDWQFPPC